MNGPESRIFIHLSMCTSMQQDFPRLLPSAERILARRAGHCRKIQRILSGGNSKDPIDLLKICGVDMTKKEPVEDALCIFEDYLAQLEALMGETK